MILMAETTFNCSVIFIPLQDLGQQKRFKLNVATGLAKRLYILAGKSYRWEFIGNIFLFSKFE